MEFVLVLRENAGTTVTWVSDVNVALIWTNRILIIKSHASKSKNMLGEFQKVDVEERLKCLITYDFRLRMGYRLYNLLSKSQTEFLQNGLTYRMEILDNNKSMMQLSRNSNKVKVGSVFVLMHARLHWIQLISVQKLGQLLLDILELWPSSVGHYTEFIIHEHLLYINSTL